MSPDDFLNFDIEESTTDALPEYPVSDGVGLPDIVERPRNTFSDLANTRRVQLVHPNIVAVGKKFYVWNRSRGFWEEDPYDSKAAKCIADLEKIVIGEYAKAKAALTGEMTEDEAAELAALWNWGAKCCDRPRLNACKETLREWQDFKGENFNRHRNLLACSNGVIDLKDGKLYKPNPLLFITSCAPTRYTPGAQAPRWKQFLEEIFNGDESIIRFLQRWLGYSMTGEVKAHSIVFHEGRGRNGKGTIMSTMQWVLGDFYAVSPANILVYEVKAAAASPEIARLLGKRMVTVSETEESMVMKEAMIKHLTGGDRLTARHLNEGYFEFMPTHKLQIFTNSKPRILGQDDAIWHRLLRVHYPNRYLTQDALDNMKPSEIDANTHLRIEDLDWELKQEAEGVLAWLVEGAKEWYRAGLQTPKAVLDYTLQYKEEQDTMFKFIKERITEDPAASEALTGTVTALFPAYRAWCSEIGLTFPWGRDRFCTELQRVMPHIKYRQEGGRTVYFGIRLTRDPADE